MKPRKWIVILGVTLLLLGLSLYVGVRVLEKNRNIERVLVERIGPLVGGAFDVERVHVGFFSVYLSNVSVSVPLHTFELDVRDIKVGLSFFKILSSRGDLSRSINKVIFVEPEIRLSYNASIPPGYQPDSANGGGFSLGDFPVKEVLIQNGTVRVFDEYAEQVLAGERLDGRVWDNQTTLNFELGGRLGAIRRNLKLSGALSQTGERHRISLRLNKARVREPLQWRNVEFRSGVIDGVCEFAFSDSFTLADMESSGWLTVERASAAIIGTEEILEDISLHVDVDDSRMMLDTLACAWRGAQLRGGGTWDLAAAQRSDLWIRCDNVIPTTFYPDLPPPFAENVLGSGWLLAGFFRDSGETQIGISMSSGGMSTWGVPLTRCVGSGYVEGRQAQLDSLVLEGPGYTMDVSGLINFEKSPTVYSLSTRFSGDAGMFSPALEGRVSLTGTVRGLGAEITYDLRSGTRDLQIYKAPVEQLGLTMRGDNNFVVFGSSEAGDITFSGRIDSLRSKNPKLSADVFVGGQTAKDAIALLPKKLAKALDTVWISAELGGTVRQVEIDGVLGVRGERVSGTLSVNGTARDSVLDWRVSDKSLLVSDTLFPLLAVGRVNADSLTVDTLNLLGGVSGHGSLTFGEAGAVLFELDMDNVLLSSCDAWFFNQAELLRDGLLGGSIRVSGMVGNLVTKSRLRLRQADIAGISPMATDLMFSLTNDGFTIPPFIIRKDNRLFISVDTVTNVDGVLRVSGDFTDVDLGGLLKSVLPEDMVLRGEMSGRFASSDSGLPIGVEAAASTITLSDWSVDSVSLDLAVHETGLEARSIKAVDSTRSRVRSGGFVPWSFLGENESETDTLRASLHMEGDLLATIARHFDSPIGGTGVGAIDVAFTVTSDTWHYSSAQMHIPEGVLTVKPFVLDDITDFSFKMTMDDSANLSTTIKGRIRKKPIIIKSTHAIPDGYEPLMVGPINAGVLLVLTPEGAVDHHMPGFQYIGDRVKVLYEKRGPFPAFALTGPIDRLGIVGTWIVGNTEWTYPFLETDELLWEFDPFPYVTWDMEIKAGRRLTYFYDVGGVKRKLIRFAELVIDPDKSVIIKGRDLDKTFALHGGLRSSRGAIYYGKVFDRNLDAGIDLVPQPLRDGKGLDNMPIIWGSAEALADTSRFDRIKLTLQVRDPETGAVSERGRFTEISFRLSSDFDEIPGESEREFYRAAGLRFASLGGAGGVVAGFGKQYIRRHLLQRVERKLARRLGLDVITFESSIASNYFDYLYDNQFRDLDLARQWDNLALANLGVTLGRYFLKDKVFLKWRTELIPMDTLLLPEHSIGFEYHPIRYLMLDFSYGFHKGEEAIEYNPRVNFQLRVPITRMRKTLKF